MTTEQIGALAFWLAVLAVIVGVMVWLDRRGQPKAEAGWGLDIVTEVPPPEPAPPPPPLVPAGTVNLGGRLVHPDCVAARRDGTQVCEVCRPVLCGPAATYPRNDTRR